MQTMLYCELMLIYLRIKTPLSCQEASMHLSIALPKAVPAATFERDTKMMTPEVWTMTLGSPPSPTYKLFTWVTGIRTKETVSSLKQCSRYALIP